MSARHLDEDFRAVRDRMIRALRPLPVFTGIQTALAEIEDTFGPGGDFWRDPKLSEALWDRLNANSTPLAAVGDNAHNLPLLSGVLFQGAGDGRGPLFARGNLCQDVLNLLESHRSDLLPAFVRHFALSEAAVSDCPKGRDAVVRLVGRVPYASVLQSAGVLAQDGAARLAQEVGPEELTETFLSTRLETLADDLSPLSREVWHQTLKLRAQRLAAAFDSKKPIGPLLDVIVNDARLPDGSLRWASYAKELAACIFGVFSLDSARLPDKNQQGELKDALMKLFGDPDDINGEIRWAGFREQGKRLLEHWRQGYSLSRALEFVSAFDRDVLKENYQWEERLHFWLCYWGAGRVRDCKVYVPTDVFNSWKYEEFRKDIKLRELRKSRGKRCVLLIALDDDLVAVEGNHNAAFHLGYRAIPGVPPKGKDMVIEFDRKYLDYQDDIVNFGTRIVHSGSWQVRVAEEIRSASKKPTPAGTVR